MSTPTRTVVPGTSSTSGTTVHAGNTPTAASTSSRYATTTPRQQHAVSGSTPWEELRSITGDTDITSVLEKVPTSRLAATTTAGQALARAAAGQAGDYQRWLSHVHSAAGCTRPIRLIGQSSTVDTHTGEVLATRSTSDMPDGVIYKACGNRRAAVCPSCAQTYRADTFHLLRAGLVGGYHIPTSVRTHPAVFLTAAAPSFGPVHTRIVSKRRGRTDEPGRLQPCRPHLRTQPVCPHGRRLYCTTKHAETDSRVGQPFCLDCYDHDHQVVWNAFSGELWRRTTITLGRILRRHAKTHGDTTVKATFGKVAEFQKRGVVHFHAIIRIDRIDPDQPDATIPPPACITTAVLEDALQQAFRTTSFTTPPHPDQPNGWLIAWGSKSIDTRPINTPTDTAIDEIAVAAYLAKYASKATEDTGHLSARLTADTIDIYADEHTHTGRLLDACWRLGGEEGFAALRRWAHMLGFGGHFFTKSRAYSTTRRAAQTRRTTWRRQHAHISDPTTDISADHDQETTLIINHLRYHGTGWHTTGDALLANTAAAKAREHQQTAKDEIASIFSE